MTASTEPTARPMRALVPVIEHVLADDVAAQHELVADRDGAGQHRGAASQHVDDEDPGDDDEQADERWARRRAASSAAALGRPDAAVIARSPARPGVPCSASRTAVTFSKYAGDSRSASSRTSPRPVVDDVGDAARARAHHDDAIGEEHRLGDRVGDEHDGGTGLGGDAGELGLQVLAGHLVEGAERLVHEQQPRLLGERAGDRDALLHAAGELVGVAVDELGEADELGELGDARGARRPCRRRAARAAARCCRRRCATAAGPPAGRRCRSPGRRAPCAAGLPKISSSPVVAVSRSAMRRSSVDLPHPDGPMSETNSPAATSRSTPVSATTSPSLVGKVLPTPVALTASRHSVRSCRRLSSAVVLLSARPMSATEPAAMSPRAIDAEGRAPRRGRVARRLAGELDEHAADAAAHADRHLGDDGADDGVRGGEAQRRQQVAARRPAAAGAAAWASSRPRSCA